MPRAEIYVGELFMKMVARETGEISKVDYHPQKRAFNPLPFPDEKFLERATPESQGVDSAFLTELIRDLWEDDDCRMHKLMFLRHGKVIAECAFEPFEMDMWHVSYSMCKSITGMAIGILIDEGKLSLDDRIGDIFSAYTGPFGIFKKSITVRQLLNMSSGVEFNEAGAISGNDWRKSFLESSQKFEPGTRFEYNSMNSYMLSAIVTEKTGQSLFDFCKERIFDPMSIKRVFWESCPQSITKGGWGLFMRAEDMAKLGQLYLQNGKWEGQQIIPEDWVKESTAHQIETGKDDSEYYGYQIWVNDDRPGSYAFNGMLGQNVFIYPDIDMVVVTNAGNSDIFQTSSMAIRIREAMRDDIEVSDEPLLENPSAYSALMGICRTASGQVRPHKNISGGGWKEKSLRMTRGSVRPLAVRTGRRRQERSSLRTTEIGCDNRLMERWLKKLDGTVYDLETSGIGVFPLMMQIVHNNFTDGMKKIGFRLDESGTLLMEIYEGEAIFRLQCGFDGKRHINDINMHGENYKVSLKSSFTRDEYDHPVIRNEVHFLEEACLRIFNIHFTSENIDHPFAPVRMELRLSEIPGTDMFLKTVRNITPESDGFESAIISRIMKGGVKEALVHAVTNTIQPVIRGTLLNPEFIMPVDEDAGTDDMPEDDE